jgi:hypothetical protein
MRKGLKMISDQKYNFREYLKNYNILSFIVEDKNTNFYFGIAIVSTLNVMAGSRF